MPKQVKIFDIPFEIISDKKAEEADYLVCVPADTPSAFTDNLTGFCCECGIKVAYRWHAPRKPKRICVPCMVELEAPEK